LPGEISLVRSAASRNFNRGVSNVAAAVVAAASALRSSPDRRPQQRCRPRGAKQRDDGIRGYLPANEVVVRNFPRLQHAQVFSNRADDRERHVQNGERATDPDCARGFPYAAVHRAARARRSPNARR
jgi:hypothetical protein